MKYHISEDLELIRNLLEISLEELAYKLGVSIRTILRMMNNETDSSVDLLEKLYDFAYKNEINLNKIKEMLYQEDHPNSHIVFHGAKSYLEGPISPLRSKNNNDFGAGFYCGEKYDQAASFVSLYLDSSVYILQFEEKGLKKVTLGVDREWMLAVAYYRGAIKTYKNHPIVKRIIDRIEKADYIVAPIADNRMFQIIDQFIDGYINDEQCKHCLAATNLGYQYVFKTDKAVERLTILERCYLSSSERKDYQSIKRANFNDGENKVKAALMKYKNKGKYIEEILG